MPCGDGMSFVQTPRDDKTIQEDANRFKISENRIRQTESIAAKRVTSHIRRRRFLEKYLND